MNLAHHLRLARHMQIVARERKIHNLRIPYLPRELIRPSSDRDAASIYELIQRRAFTDVLRGVLGHREEIGRRGLWTERVDEYEHRHSNVRVIAAEYLPLTDGAPNPVGRRERSNRAVHVARSHSSP